MDPDLKQEPDPEQEPDPDSLEMLDPCLDPQNFHHAEQFLGL